MAKHRTISSDKRHLLKSFLMNKRMVVRENGTYSYNPDFYYWFSVSFSALLRKRFAVWFSTGCIYMSWTRTNFTTHIYYDKRDKIYPFSHLLVSTRTWADNEKRNKALVSVTIATGAYTVIQGWNHAQLLVWFWHRHRRPHHRPCDRDNSRDTTVCNYINAILSEHLKIQASDIEVWRKL